MALNISAVGRRTLKIRGIGNSKGNRLIDNTKIISQKVAARMQGIQSLISLVVIHLTLLSSKKLSGETRRLHTQRKRK